MKALRIKQFIEYAGRACSVRNYLLEMFSERVVDILLEDCYQFSVVDHGYMVWVDGIGNRLDTVFIPESIAEVVDVSTERLNMIHQQLVKVNPEASFHNIVDEVVELIKKVRE